MKTWSEHLEDYLRLRRHLGFKLVTAGRELRQFVRFLEQKKARFITIKLALQWAQSTTCRQMQADRLGVVRGFARYLSALVPRTEIPPEGLILFRRQRKAPYLYSDQEVVRLIQAARQLPTSDQLDPSTCSTLFGLLAATGMRISEALGLDREDVDLKQSLLTLRQTKDGQWRLVPIHPTVRDKLRQYERCRDGLCPQPACSNFFVTEQGTALVYMTVYHWFIHLSHQIGLRQPTDHRGPHIHDLRHRFAIQTLLKWYRSDLNVEVHLADLSTYLGHRSVVGTYWYISGIPELLKLATLRLEREHGGLRA